MSTTHQDKSSDKSSKRDRKGGQREQKAGRQKKPKPDQREGDQTDAMIASADVQGSGTAAAVKQSSVGAVEVAEIIAVEEVAAADISSTDVPASAGESPPVNMQTIANACQDYTRISFLENKSYVEKLMNARSLDKAVEVQADFATQAYANFVAQSHRIFGLYGELARQSFTPGKRQA